MFIYPRISVTGVNICKQLPANGYVVNWRIIIRYATACETYDSLRKRPKELRTNGCSKPMHTLVSQAIAAMHSYKPDMHKKIG